VKYQKELKGLKRLKGLKGFKGFKVESLRLKFGAFMLSLK
jgi:hypothetical protein